MSWVHTIPIIGDLVKGTTEIIKEAVTDKDKKIVIEAQLKQLELEAKNTILAQESKERIAQIEVNKEEAKAKSPVGTWRQGMGWVCVAAFGFNFIVVPLFGWGVSILSIWMPEVSDMQQPPTLSLSEIMPVLLGMLGLGGMRTFEKKNGVHNK